MSATITLYKVIPDVVYKGCIFDTHTRKDCGLDKKDIPCYEMPVYLKEANMGAPLLTQEIFNSIEKYSDWLAKYDEWSFEIEKSAWSDGNFHEKLDLFYYKNYMLYNEWLKLKEICRPIPTNTGFGYATLNIPVNEVWSTSGWFLKDSFFKQKKTVFVTTSKKRMLDYLHKYLNLKYNKTNHKGRYYEILEQIIPTLKQEWDDTATMIFVCGF